MSIVVSRAGLSVVTYVTGTKAVSHLRRSDGRTVCGAAIRGPKWKLGTTFNFEQDCKRCARAARRGMAPLLRSCPKCERDMRIILPLLPNHTCPVCGNQWT